MNVRSSAKAASRGDRIQVEHLDAGEVFAGLTCRAPPDRHRVRRSRRPAEPPTASTPTRKRHGAADHRAGDAAADAIDQHAEQQRQRQHRVLRSKADREAGEQRAEDDHPARRRHAFGRQAPIARVASGCCRHHASASAACAASAAASPGTSLIGRTARYQNSGHATAKRRRRERARIERRATARADESGRVGIADRADQQASTRYSRTIARDRADAARAPTACALRSSTAARRR